MAAALWHRTTGADGTVDRFGSTVPILALGENYAMALSVNFIKMTLLSADTHVENRQTLTTNQLHYHAD